MAEMLRRRMQYAALAGAIILLGLVVHFYGTLLGARVRDGLGDAMWAAMICAGISALLPRRSPLHRSVAALCVCYAVEFSQLWHTPTLDQFRATQIGALMLGSGFDARDLVAYALGIGLFAWFDRRWVLRT